MAVKTYDQKCWDLADVFLSDEPHIHDAERTRKLALAIQQAIEDFIECENDNYEPSETGDAWSGGFAENH